MDERSNTSPIDRLLLDQNFITKEDLEKARQIREKNLKRADLSLGMILLKEKYITKQDLNGLLAHPETKVFIHLQLKDNGWASKDVLSSFSMGQISLRQMVETNIITRKRFNHLLHQAFDRVALLKLALKMKLINGKTLERILLMKRYHKSLSEILLDEHLVSLSELNYVYRKCDANLRLGSILQMQGLVTEEQVSSALIEQKGKHMSLGQILFRKQYISLAQLYFALSIQYNTPFRDLVGFMYTGKQDVELRDIIGQTYARENKIIPLFVTGNNLTVAVSNPTQIVKMHELMAMYTHLSMNCVLITDEKFEQLYALLYGEMFKAMEVKPQQSVSQTSGNTDKWVLTDPSAQSWLMVNLYERYEAMCNELGNDIPEGAKDLFLSFVQSSYDDICSTYKCDSVSFWFEKNDTGPAIKASPVIVTQN